MSVGDEIRYLRDQIAQRDEVIARQAAEIILLKQSVDALCRRIFGPSSEKLDPAQLEFLLAGDLAQTPPAAAAEPAPAAEISTHFSEFEIHQNSLRAFDGQMGRGVSLGQPAFFWSKCLGGRRVRDKQGMRGKSLRFPKCC